VFGADDVSNDRLESVVLSEGAVGLWKVSDFFDLKELARECDVYIYGELRDGKINGFSAGGLAIGRRALTLSSFYGAENKLDRALVASGALALEKQNAINSVRRSVVLGGSDIFAGPIGSISRKRAGTSNPFSYDANSFGFVLAGTKSAPVKLRTFDAGVFAGISSCRAHYDGPAVKRFLKSERRDCIGGITARYVGHGYNNLTNSVQATLSLAHGRITSERANTIGGDLFLGKFNDFGAQFDLALAHGIRRGRDVECSCFVDICYDLIGQNGLSETAKAASPIGAVTFGSVRHHFATSELGLCLESFRPGPLHLRAKLGWQCAAFRKHNDIDATIAGVGGPMPFVGDVYYGRRNGATASIGATHMIGGSWDVNFNLDGQFFGDYSSCSAGLSFVRIF
jgi:hypothetical protein